MRNVRFVWIQFLIVFLLVGKCYYLLQRYYCDSSHDWIIVVVRKGSLGYHLEIIKPN